MVGIRLGEGNMEACGWKIQLGEGSVLSASWWGRIQQVLHEFREQVKLQKVSAEDGDAACLEEDVEGSGRWSLHLS